ncbi:MAG: hypothetical protein VX603_16670 [Gemmatimonadota bacterium]|nr:hypothetical protein [Gemmatimonadota bacterium]
MSRTLPRTKEAFVIGDQMIRSATSVDANFGRFVGHGLKQSLPQN